jgi:hypothetical protein
MILVKPYVPDFFKKINLEKYANTIFLYKNSEKGNINNHDHLDVLFLDAVREFVNLDDLEIKVPYSVELKDRWTGLPILGKSHIDLIIKKSNSDILLQTIFNDDVNYDINNFILECLKLSLEYGNYKHIILCCNKLVFNSYFNNLGQQKKININEYSNLFNFNIENIEYKIDYFELCIKNCPIEIEQNLLLIDFEITGN